MPIDWRAETCLIAVDSTLSGDLGDAFSILWFAVLPIGA
jgi:hypothetical protein